MPVDFTPVQITVNREPAVINKFLSKLPTSKFKKLTDTCILFWTHECAKRFMKRFGNADQLYRKPKQFDDSVMQLKTKAAQLKKPVVNPSDLTVARRKKFPKVIYASIDGQRKIRCLVRPGGYIYCFGHKIKLSGRKWKKSGFYAIFE